MLALLLLPDSVSVKKLNSVYVYLVSRISKCSISAVFVIVDLAFSIAYLICMVCLYAKFYMSSSTGSLNMAIRLRAKAFYANMAAVVFYILPRYYMNKCHTFLHDFFYHVSFEDLKVCCANVGEPHKFVCVHYCISSGYR